MACASQRKTIIGNSHIFFFWFDKGTGNTETQMFLESMIKIIKFITRTPARWHLFAYFYSHVHIATYDHHTGISF